MTLKRKVITWRVNMNEKKWLSLNNKLIKNAHIEMFNHVLEPFVGTGTISSPNEALTSERKLRLYLTAHLREQLNQNPPLAGPSTQIEATSKLLGVIALAEHMAEGLPRPMNTPFQNRGLNQYVEYSCLDPDAIHALFYNHPHLIDIECDIIREIIGNPFKTREPSNLFSIPTIRVIAKEAYTNPRVPCPMINCQSKLEVQKRMNVSNVLRRRIVPRKYWPCHACQDTTTVNPEVLDISSMQVLADILEDHDYSDQDVLDHLRNTQIKHYRGCWALDHVLMND